MGSPRRTLAALMSVALVAVVCATVPVAAADAHGRPPHGHHGDDGYVSPERWRAAQDGYLRYATQELAPGSALNVIANAERARRDRRFHWDPSAVTSEALAGPLAAIAGWKDTSDFDVLYLVNLILGYGRQLPPATVRTVVHALLGFEYWFTEPTPPGVVDEKYYWSENHRIIFHTVEYLMGDAYPRATFRNDGRTGAAHRDEARGRILEWLDEKARLGFSEWHSDVYYQKDITPLLTLAELAPDREIATRASMVLDLFLFDVALHLQHGNMGVTHGRSYAKDKTKATDEDVFNLAKLLFDDTKVGYTSRGDAAVLFARARRYRLPSVIRRVARSDAPMVDRERMGVPLDAAAPVVADPPAPSGFGFETPRDLEFWWERNAQPVWQVIPLTARTVNQYDLWDTPTFSPFAGFRDLLTNDPAAAQRLAQALSPILSYALLSEANTVTYRSKGAMLSTVQDFRPGTYGDQVQSWQATLDEDAVVFTTNPKNEPFPHATSWPDEDGYWTGSGELPRSAQHGATSINLYSPLTSAKGALPGFDRLDLTHAFFPTERFDEVVRSGHWTFGRKRDGYVALYSWRPTRWRTYAPGEVFTNGLTKPFDLVAPGGPDNVWIAQVGDRRTAGSFAAFRASLERAPVHVAARPVRSDGLPGGFDVTFASPTEGRMALGQDGPFTVRGRTVDLRNPRRYDNPWAKVDFGSQRYRIADRRSGLVLDFATGRRRTTT